MSRHTSEDQSENTAPSLLQSRPQRKAKWRRRRALFVVLLLAGAAIIVGTGTVLAVSSTTNSTANTTSSANTNKQLPSSCGQGSLPLSYWKALLGETAQGLHLSVAQVKAQIKGGKSIQDVASEQGISAEQLQSIETSALRAANNQMVSMQCESQAKADANVQGYINKGPQDMNNHFTDWFATQWNIQ
jgi:hypothetical protein